MSILVREIWSLFGTWMVTAAGLAYFIWLAAPDLTWVNTDADGTIYLAAAKYLIPSHPTGAPLYNLFNFVWLRAWPFGSEFWRLSLVSAVPAGITCGVLYRYTGSIIPPLVYAAAGVVVSQATMIETYGISSLIMVLMYFWRHHPHRVAWAAFAGLGIHHLVALTFIPIVTWHVGNSLRDIPPEERLRALLPTLRPFWPVLLTPLWYVYLPLAYYDGSLWVPSNDLHGWLTYFSGNAGLILGLAIIPTDDLLIRLADLGPVMLGGLLAATVPVLMRFRNDLLTWLFVLPVLHYALGFPHVTYIYTMPAFAFAGIMAWEALRDRPRTLSYAVAGVAAFACVVNFYAYDIGRTLDGDQTAVRFYRELDTLPDGAMIWVYSRGWEYTTAVLYSFNTGKDIETPLSRKDIIFQERPLDEIRNQVEMAHADGRLYHTVVDNPGAYAVHLEPAQPEDIWDSVVNEYYGTRRPPDIPPAN